MNFDQAQAYLYSLGNEVSAMKLGLESVRRLLRELGDPQDSFLKVQVAGTNGKGSVCAFLESICCEAAVRTGLKVGVFTSPHLVSITERVRINGSNISESEFARVATLVRQTVERLVDSGELESTPTFFEQTTSIALVQFATQKIDIAILETGLGGRLDATTAAGAEIAAITRIDIDHQEYLGETIEEIAGEKAAIITGKTEFVAIAEQTSAVTQALLDRLKVAGKEAMFGDFLAVRSEGEGLVFKTGLNEYEISRLGLLGRHQVENAKVALLVAEELSRRFNFVLRDITAGLEKAKHPGRLEREGNFLFDGAHNINGSVALREYLDEYVHKPITMIFGAMKGKDVERIARLLWPKASKLILTRPENSRALTADELATFVPEGFDGQLVLSDSVSAALEEVSTSDEEIVLVTGSLYLIGEVKSLFNN
ncbi:MAG: bifunctional folylpolyglutamate synthase/dihydrofolate synthase [Acidobacteria bacterium]|nr:bifunctional folylpolyglutamate synthase/dihydrofolate synthase [Acidobacteriota bacterium]